jgi:hypothetical protein
MCTTAIAAVTGEAVRHICQCCSLLKARDNISICLNRRWQCLCSLPHSQIVTVTRTEFGAPYTEQGTHNEALTTGAVVSVQGGALQASEYTTCIMKSSATSCCSTAKHLQGPHSHMADGCGTQKLCVRHARPCMQCPVQLNRYMPCLCVRLHTPGCQKEQSRHDCTYTLHISYLTRVMSYEKTEPPASMLPSSAGLITTHYMHRVKHYCFARLMLLIVGLGCMHAA